MAGRRRKDREILEVYLLHLLLAYRPLLRISGLFLSIYALVSLSLSLMVSLFAFWLAILLLALTFSYRFTLYFAKFGAWAGTFWKKE